MTGPDPMLANAIATADSALRVLTLLLERDGAVLEPHTGEIPLEGLGIRLGGVEFIIREVGEGT